jgi:hypothetical protein
LVLPLVLFFLFEEPEPSSVDALRERRNVWSSPPEQAARRSAEPTSMADKKTRMSSFCSKRHTDDAGCYFMRFRAFRGESHV